MNGNRRGSQLLAEINSKLSHVIRNIGDVKGNGSAGAGDASGPVDVKAFQLATRLQTLIDPQELLEAILDTLIYVTGAERGFLMLVEEGRKLRFKVGRSIDQQKLHSENSRTSRSIIKQVITTGEPVLMNDTSEQGGSTSVRQLDLQSILCVPLRFGRRHVEMGADGSGVQEQVGGVVYMDSRRTRKEFGQAELALVRTLADQAAMAIENGRLIDQFRTHRERGEVDQGKITKLRENISRLLSVGRAISSTLIMDELFVLIVDNVLELTKAERGYLMLLDDDRKPVYKIGRAATKKGMIELEETKFFFSRTITSRALDEQRSICVTDAMGGDGGDASMSMMQMELQSVMCTPLREKGGTLGLLYVDSRATNREFEKSDIELFEALAGQAAIALRNAMLYEEAKEQERLKSELAIASQIQTDILPKITPEVEGLDVYGYFKPAKEVSGDYYDFLLDASKPGQALTVAIGDVSGKGVPAGLVMVMARCFLKSLVSHYGPTNPRETLAHLNSILCQELKPGMFMTLLLIGWDATTQSLRYSSAGHEHIIIHRQSTGQVEKRKSGGAPLGISESSTSLLKDNDLDLAPGDTAVLYTDGVTECMSEDEEEWGMDAFLETVGAHGHQSAKELVDVILGKLVAHRGRADPSDDVTMVVVKRT